MPLTGPGARAARWTVEALGLLAAGLLVGAAVVVARLAAGPVPAGPLVPLVERQLAEHGWAVEIGEAELTWARPGRPPVLAATDLRLAGDGAERPAAVLDSIRVTLDRARLLDGALAPEQVALHGLELTLTLVRAADGGLSIAGVDAGAAGGAGLGPLGVLLEPPDQAAGPYAALSRVSLAEGAVEIRAPAGGVVARATDVGVELRRGAAATTAEIGLAVPVGDEPVRIAARGGYRPAAGEGRLEVEMRGLDTGALLERLPRDWMPEGGRPVALETRLDARLDLGLGPGLTPGRLGFTVDGGPGVLSGEALYPQPLAIAGLSVRGMADPAARALHVERARLDLGDGRLEAEGVLTESAGTVWADGRVGLFEVPTDRFDRVWPRGVMQGARDWMTANLARGSLDRAEAVVAARLPMADLAAATVERLDGELEFSGVSVTYLDGLPPVEGVDGSVTVDRDGMTVTTRGGRLLDLETPASTSRIAFLETVETADIAVDVAGPVRTVLELLAMPRLGYAQALGLDPASAGGRAAGRLEFAFPLLRALTLDEIAIAIDAAVEDGRVGTVAPGLAADGIDAALALDGAGLEMTGTGAVNGLPVAFDWAERFQDNPEFLTRLALQARAPAADLARLGVPAEETLTGPVAVEAVYTDLDRVRQSLAVEADLAAAAVAVEPVGPLKAAGTPGRLALTARLERGELVRLDDVSIDLSAAATPLTADGAVVLAREGGPTLVSIDRLVHGGTELSGRVARATDGAVTAELRGPRLDLAPLLDALLDPGAEPAAPSWRTDRPVAARLEVDAVALRNGVAFEGVRALVRHDGDRLRRLDLDAAGETGAATGAETGAEMGAETGAETGAEAAGVRVRYAAPADGSAELSVALGDAGRVASGLGLLGTLEGGTLSLEARRAGWQAPLAGDLVLESFRLRQAPVLARLLAAVSLSGLRDLLTTEGIEFGRLEAGLALDEERLRVDRARMSGGSLGVTLEGRLDLDAERIDAAGTIVPIYGLNRVIGAIPVLGTLLTGGEGQGLIAFTYQAEGPLDDPSVSVNPLSVLAPGFLRTLFFLDAPGRGEGSDWQAVYPENE